MSPSTVTPQLCTLPAATRVNLSPPATGVGVDCMLKMLPPVPSCPSAFPPQQYASDCVLTAQEWLNPVATIEKKTVAPPLAGVIVAGGSIGVVVGGSAAWAWMLFPQHFVEPFECIFAHVVTNGPTESPSTSMNPK